MDAEENGQHHAEDVDRAHPDVADDAIEGGDGHLLEQEARQHQHEAEEYDRPGDAVAARLEERHARDDEDVVHDSPTGERLGSLRTSSRKTSSRPYFFG
jgi:hypothetical protein